MVYRARDPELGRTIAIKLVRVRDSDTDEAVSRRQTRMLREAQALARVRHPNVVTVHDVGLHQNELFIAMELLEGITLKQWLREKKRHWREIVEKFIPAGRGLLAAHRAGLIHRDFKPSNVLFGHDNRVHVIDFGLVTPDQSDDVDTEFPETGLDSPAESGPITRAGSVMGTVAYMSPEQLGRESLDPRSDQFSFCVTLFEALYGIRPYTGTSPHHLMYNYIDGNIAKSPRGVAPRWLDRVCRRGLSPRPDQRYRDMQQLLAALERGLGRRRRYVFAAGLVATLAAGLAGASMWSGDTTSPCSPEQLESHTLWQQPLRGDVRRAIVDTKMPFADERWQAVDRMMEDDNREHIEAVSQVCQQTADGNVPVELAEARTRCLAQRHHTVVERLEDLAHAGPETVVPAIESLSDLPTTARCLQLSVPDVASDDRVYKLQRALDQSVDQQLAAAASRDKAGKYREALELVQAATGAADRGASDEVRAHAWTLQASIESHLGQTSEATRSRERALRLAERTDTDDLWLSLVAGKVRSLGVDAFRVEDAKWWSDEAKASFREKRLHPLRAADLEAAIADLDWISGDLTAAIAAQRRSLELREHLLGPDHLDVAQSLNDLAVVLADDGQPVEAKALLERALRIREAALGHNHPLIASTLNNLGTVLREQNDLRGARNVLERSLAVKRLHWGDHHPHTARALHNLGRLAREQGDLEGAVELYEQALEIRTKALGPQHPDVATTLNAMAVALKKLGEYAKAQKAFEQALELRRTQLGPDHPKLAATHNSLGLLLVEQGMPQQALVHFHRAVDIRTAHLSPDDPKLTWAKRNLGHAALLSGNATMARQLLRVVLERDEADVATGKTSAKDLAATKFWLAQASVAPEADVLIKQARTLASTEGETQLVSEIDRWLATHP